MFLYAGPDYVLSVRYGKAAPLAGVRVQLERNTELLAHGPGAVLQAALLHVVRSYGPVVDGLEHDVREVERDVFSERRTQPTKRIHFLIREMLDFLVALEPMSASVRRLTSPECSPWVAGDIVALFRDVDDALSEIVEHGRVVHQLLNNALAASLAQVSMRQNEDMRRISAWVAIGVIPTIVACLFGMNLGGIPGATHWAGFIVVVALTALACSRSTAASRTPTGCDPAAHRDSPVQIGSTWAATDRVIIGAPVVRCSPGRPQRFISAGYECIAAPCGPGARRPPPAERSARTAGQEGAE